MGNFPEHTSYLGNYFWWLCDCAEIKEILEYEGSILMIYSGDQEILGYHFSTVHQSRKLMSDVDALTRIFKNIMHNTV